MIDGVCVEESCRPIEIGEFTSETFDMLTIGWGLTSCGTGGRVHGL